MIRNLLISDETASLDRLTLSLEAVTQTFAILAKRGVGKTYTASVMAEEMLGAGQQIVAIDPTGAWWGLRTRFKVAVFGGDHGELPLEVNSGEVIAQALAAHGFSAILDLTGFSKGKSMQFMWSFAETLYRANRNPLHLFVDEADAFAPQGRSGYGGDENRMLGAMEDIVRRGRKKGIGCTLITQRPQVLNKNVLTQCESLFAMRMVHPKDIGAVMEWVRVHADEDQADAMLKSLPTLGIGEAWFWSPGWLNKFQQVKIRKRLTFDSGATPKAGEQPVATPKLQPVDLDALGEKIKATVEQAKDNNPSELKRKLAELQKQLAHRPEQVKQVEVPVLKNGQLAQAESLVERLSNLAKTLQESALAMATAISKTKPQPDKKVTERRNAPLPATRPQRVQREPSTGDDVDALSSVERKFLTVLAQREGKPTVRNQLAVLAGYSAKSRHVDNTLSSLRTKGYIDGRGELHITKDGHEALGPFEDLPMGSDLLNYWLHKLDAGPSTMLKALADVYPNTLTRDEIAERSGYSVTSRHVDNCLSTLRTRELIEGRGDLKASDELFG